MSGWNQEQEYQAGVRTERERIIKLLEQLKNKTCHSQTELTQHIIKDAIALIKDENRNITSEILPDGTIYIAEIKGEK